MLIIQFNSIPYVIKALAYMPYMLLQRQHMDTRRVHKQQTTNENT